MLLQEETEEVDIYNGINQYDFPLINKNMINNRLLCTFVEPDNVDRLVEELRSRYTILYNKMFVLEVENKQENIITYNIGNIICI